MKYYIKKICLFFIITFSAYASLFAAKVVIVSPDGVLPTGSPITVQLYIDPEDEVLSGIAGALSFPTDMFSVSDISLESSVVSLWATAPSLSLEKGIDNRTRIIFEGIFPGGYEGVRSPYYYGKKMGALFSVELLPRNKGKGALLIDDLLVNRFDSSATPLPVSSSVKIINVPQLISAVKSVDLPPDRIKNDNLIALITRDPLINNNAWYLAVNESDPTSSLKKMLVAETEDYNAEMVNASSWREAKNPYVLLYQDRTKNVHVKLLYANNTYTTVTLYAVENSVHISNMSRILVSVVFVLLILYFYAKNIKFFFKRNY